MHSNVRSSNNLDDGDCETGGGWVIVIVEAADELVKNEASSE